MAYQPTRKRQYKINPVGIVPMSGLRQLGNSFNNMADTVRDIDADIEKDQLNDALLQAESLGEAQQATFIDGKGSVKPFVPGSIQDQIDVSDLKGQSIKRVQAQYLKSSQAVFQTAIVNEAVNAARVSYESNSGNPDGIAADQAAFMDALKKKHKDGLDLINQVDLDIQQAFAGEKNRALHVQRKNFQEDTAREVNSALGTIANKHASIVASGALGGNPITKSNAESEIASLDRKRAALYDTLKTINGVSDSEIDALEKSHRTAVQAQVVENTVSFIHKNEGSEAAFQNIQDLANQLRTSDDVNGETIIKVAEARFQALETSERLAAAELSNAQSAAFGKAVLQIYTGKIKDIKQLSEFQVTDGQMGTLTQIFNGAVSTAASQTAAINKTAFEANIAAYKNPEYDPKGRTRSAIHRDIVAGFTSTNPTVTFPQLVDFLKLEKDTMIKGMETQGNQVMVSVQLALSADQPIHPPATFTGMTKELLNRGIIGPQDGSVMSLSDWQSKLNGYRSRYETHFKKLSQFSQIQNKVDKRQPLTASDVTFLDNGGYIPNKIENGQLLDVGSSDPTTASSSREIAIGWSLQHSAMHPALEPFLKGDTWITDNSTMATTVGIQSQLQRSLMMKYNNNKLMVDRVMSDMGIDTSIINENLRYSTVDQAKFDISSKGNENFKRMIKELYPERDGEPLTRLETFKSIFENDDNKRGVVNALLYGITHSHLPILDENGIPERTEHKLMFDQFVTDGADLSDVIAADGKLINLIFDAAEADLLSGKYKKGPDTLALAVKDNMIRLMDNIGLQRNNDDEVELVMHPILKVAQDTAAGFPNAVIATDDIKENTTEIIRSNPIAFQQKGMVADAILEGNYIYKPNAVFGEKPTYSVFVETDDGQIVKLLPSYSFHFKKSRQFKAYDEALNKMKSNDLKRFMASLPLLDDTVMQATYNSMNEYGRSEETFAFIKRAYNKAGYSIFGFDNFDPAKIGKDDMELFTDYMMTLGISGAK